MNERVDFHVIDDSGDIVDFAVAVLQAEGYACLGFTSSGDYLKQVESGSLPLPKCVITDISMPEVGGKRLMTEILAQQADQHFIVMTGYTGESFEKHLACVYLRKPFLVDTLLDAARATLHCIRFGTSPQIGCETLGDNEGFVEAWECPVDCRDCD